MADSMIFEYGNDQIRTIMNNVLNVYLENSQLALNHEDWLALGFPTLLGNPKQYHIRQIQYPADIRIAPSAVEMLEMCKLHTKELNNIQFNSEPSEVSAKKTQLLREILQPASVIHVEEQPTIHCNSKYCKDPLPVWFNSSAKELNLRVGFLDGDSAKPYGMVLGGESSHILVGAGTGRGKSVLMHDLICNLQTEYAPWEVNIYLADFKLQEFVKYVNLVQTPAVKAVAATTSTEFVLSLYRFLQEEMKARNVLFSLCDVQKIEDFRTKFNLVMPRIVLFVDEFVQMWVNIMATEKLGNDSASEDKKEVNDVISDIARLGRAAGMHLVFSSQNMSGALDDQTSKQFPAGIALGCDAEISKLLIGNTAASKLRGLGTCIVNTNKDVGLESDNANVRVPYLQSEVKDKNGIVIENAVTPLQNLLLSLDTLAKSVGYQNKIVYYNETLLEPYSLYKAAIQLAKETTAAPNIGSELANKAYKAMLFTEVPLGKELSFSNAISVLLPMTYTQNCNMLVASTVTQDRMYILSLLMEYFNTVACDNIVVSCDPVMFSELDVKSKLSNCKIMSSPKLPDDVFLKYTNRKILLEAQKFIDDNLGGTWQDSQMLDYFMQVTETRASDVVDWKGIMQYVIDKSEIPLDSEVGKEFGIESSNSADVANVFSLFGTAREGFVNQATKYSASSFPPIVLWFIGFEGMTSVNGETAGYYRDFFAHAPETGIFSIMTASLWDGSASRVCANFNYVLEHSDKSLFYSIDLPKKININPNSFQVHKREGRKRVIVREYYK